MIRYGTLCSGIEAPSVAVEPLGWKPVFFSEIEKFPKAVLAHHYPDVPDLGDMTDPGFTAQACQCGPIDAIIAGTPCQAFSVAGLRKSLADERGNLTLRFVEICDELDPQWIVWENVPGVLSTGDNAFGCLLAGLVGDSGPITSWLADGKWPRAGLVVGPRRAAAWRILDAQYFHLAQRRRRVFVTCRRAGNGSGVAAVLFEPESLPRNTAPSREARTDVAGPLTNCAPGDRWRCDGSDINHYVTHPQAFGGNNTAGPIDVATACNAHGGPHGRQDFESETFITHPLTARYDSGHNGSGRGTPIVPVTVGPLCSHSPEHGHAMTTQQAAESGHVVAFDTTQITSPANYSDPKPGDPCHPLAAGAHPPAIAYQCHGGSVGPMGTLRAGGTSEGNGVPFMAANMAVRRLTPRECERLQGFPDDYTLIPVGKWRRISSDEGKHLMAAGLGRFVESRGYWRTCLAADGPRYRAIGNAMPRTVMRWIFERLQMVHELTKAERS